MQGARAYFKHGRLARARSSNFPVSSKRLTSFKRPAGVKGPFPLFTFFLNSEFTQGIDYVQSHDFQKRING
ncbi:hypothetical protein TNCV_1596341 [Trichonephila clavipes]|nr:hypothetical protein TNCV_1596341 [Trichonephila clavipes]